MCTPSHIKVEKTNAKSNKPYDDLSDQLPRSPLNKTQNFNSPSISKYMFRQQVVPLHAPFFNQIHFPNPKLNPRLKNLIIQGTHPTNRGSQLKLRTSVQKFTKFQNHPTQSITNQKFQNSTQVYVHISPTPKIILQAVKQATTPPHQSLDHPPDPNTHTVQTVQIR